MHPLPRSATAGREVTLDRSEVVLKRGYDVKRQLLRGLGVPGAGGSGAWRVRGPSRIKVGSWLCSWLQATKLVLRSGSSRAKRRLQLRCRHLPWISGFQIRSLYSESLMGPTKSNDVAGFLASCIYSHFVTLPTPSASSGQTLPSAACGRLTQDVSLATLTYPRPWNIR